MIGMIEGGAFKCSEEIFLNYESGVRSSNLFIRGMGTCVRGFGSP
jgi:hypothetical protein